MTESRPSSPPSKRVKLEPSPSPPADLPEATEANDGADNLEEEHCTICLQSFIDRTIIPTCAHEFCFECILLWSEQSRKCPLCSRSFDNSYLIHRIRSQYDYQKHYLPPSRTSPPPLVTGDSRARALRNTRRERQWGRRERQRREEADQLERAISRRRWIYQHNLYAKHIASNSYTRYRPFPTPAQFAASPDLISRMTTFLRRELRVWPNLDVEFLTTYTISLMKSIDIRSESAVKLLSEFLDLDTPYIEGARHVNAEHFAHEIYSYLRSPYRDLNTYDQMAQYDSPSEIPQPQEIGRGNRWTEELPPRSRSPLSPSRRSRSRSNSRHRSPIPHRENRAVSTPPTEYPKNTSAEARHKGRPTRRHARSRSPQNTRPSPRERDSRYHISRQHSPRDGVHDYVHSSSTCPEASSSATRTEDQVTRLPTPLQFPEDKKGKRKATVNMEEPVPASSTPKMSGPQYDDAADSAAISSGHSTSILFPAVGTLQATGDEGDNHVDQVSRGSSANSDSSRKRSARLGDTFVRPPRNRTLSESIQAHLSRPARHITESTKERSTLLGDNQPTPPSDKTKKFPDDKPPTLLLRPSDAATHPDVVNSNSARTANVEMSLGHPPLRDEKATDNDNNYLQSSEFFVRCSPTTASKLNEHPGRLNARSTPSALPSYDDTSASVVRSPDHREFPPSKGSTLGAGASHTPTHAHASASSSSSSSSSTAQSRSTSGSIQTQRSDDPRPPPPHTEAKKTSFLVANTSNHTGRPGDRKTTTTADDRRSLLLRRLEEEQQRAISLGRQRTVTDTDSEASGEPRKAPLSESCEGASRDADGGGRGIRDVGEVPGIGDIESPSSSTTTPFPNTNSGGNSATLDLESRLRMRALLRVRLAAMKGAVREASESDVHQDHDDAGQAGKSAPMPISGEREETLRGLLRERRA